MMVVLTRFAITAVERRGVACETRGADLERLGHDSLELTFDFRGCGDNWTARHGCGHGHEGWGSFQGHVGRGGQGRDGVLLFELSIHFGLLCTPLGDLRVD